MPNQIKTCPPDKILNPISNRCVKRTGKIGKQILATQTPATPRGQTPATPRGQTKTCPPDKILNPDTKRCVKRDGKIGKQILANNGPQPASPKKDKKLSQRTSTGKPKDNEEGYDVLMASYMTVKEFIEDCREDKEVPIVFTVDKKLIFFTASNLKSMITRGAVFTGEWNKCDKLDNRKNISQYTKFKDIHLNNNRGKYIKSRNKLYFLTNEIFTEIVPAQGLVDVKEIKKLTKVNKLTYVNLKRGEKIVSYISSYASFRYSDKNCEPLPYPHYEYHVKYLN